MGIALTDDDRELAKIAGSFLSAHSARGAAHELLEAAEEALPPIWRDIAEIGWLGLHIDGAHGGSERSSGTGAAMTYINETLIQC